VQLKENDVLYCGQNCEGHCVFISKTFSARGRRVCDEGKR